MGGGGSAQAGAASDDVETRCRRQGGEAKALTGVEAKDLRSLADEGKKKLGSGIVILLANDPDGKAALVVGVTADLTSEQRRGDGAKGVEVLGGKGGGGRPDMAQGGGPNGAEARRLPRSKLW